MRTAREEIRSFYFDELNWCACGAPEEALDLLQKVLATFHEREISEDEAGPKWKRFHEIIESLLGKPLHGGLFWSYLYTLDAAGLLEHGSNVSGSWLTPKGRDILAALECSNLETILDETADELDL
jgi:hypothetical protein